MVRIAVKSLVLAGVVMFGLAGTASQADACHHRHGCGRGACGGCCWSGCSTGCGAYGWSGYGAASTDFAYGLGYGYGNGCGCSGIGSYGSAIVPPMGPMPTPAPFPMAPASAIPAPPPPPAPGKTSVYAPASEINATLTISVPADAKVTINGVETKSLGSTRLYELSGLRAGYGCKCEVKAVIVRDGRPVEATRIVTVIAGQRADVAIDFRSNPTEGLAAGGL